MVSSSEALAQNILIDEQTIKKNASNQLKVNLDAKTIKYNSGSDIVELNDDNDTIQYDTTNDYVKTILHWEKIASTTISSSTASVSYDSLSSDYKWFKIHIVNRNTGGSTVALGLRFNDDTGTNYAHAETHRASGAVGSSWDTAANRVNVGYSAQNGSNVRSHSVIYFDNDTSSYRRTVSGHGEGVDQRAVSFSGQWTNTSNLITKVTLLPASGSFDAGSVIHIFGMKG